MHRTVIRLSAVVALALLALVLPLAAFLGPAFASEPQPAPSQTSNADTDEPRRFPTDAHAGWLEGAESAAVLSPRADPSPCISTPYRVRPASPADRVAVADLIRARRAWMTQRCLSLRHGAHILDLVTESSEPTDPPLVWLLVEDDQAIAVTLLWARLFPELRLAKTFDPPDIVNLEPDKGATQP